MEKEELTVMSVNKYVLLVCIVGLPLIASAQLELLPQRSKDKKSWSFMFAAGASRSKLANAVGYSPQYYVNLRVREPYLFSYRVEASQERVYKKGWEISKGVGFASYSYIQYMDYDREASIGTDYTHRFNYLYANGNFKIGKSLRMEKFWIMPYVGLTANYLLSVKYTYTNKYGGGHSNFANKFKPWALGWEVGTKFAYKYSDDFSIELRPSFNKIEKKYSTVQTGERKLYSYTVGIGIIKRIKK